MIHFSLCLLPYKSLFYTIHYSYCKYSSSDEYFTRVATLLDVVEYYATTYRLLVLHNFDALPHFRQCGVYERTRILSSSAS